MWRTVPGSVAAAYGLGEGDVIVSPVGEAPLTLDHLLARLKTREELTVARRQGEVWVDLVLPQEPGVAA